MHENPNASAPRLGPLPKLIFASRWLQLPLYLGLIVAQGVYVVQFLAEKAALNLQLVEMPDRRVDVSFKSITLDAALQREGRLPTRRAIGVAIEMTIAGVRELRVLPLARNTRATMASAWRDPNFLGGYLPATRRIDASGFAATWQVLELNRDYGQAWRFNDVAETTLSSSGFGVELYLPADVYLQNERSGKYGILMVALVFVALFLFEVIAGAALHPVQYLLIGLALALFYLLLLALHVVCPLLRIAEDQRWIIELLVGTPLTVLLVALQFRRGDTHASSPVGAVMHRGASVTAASIGTGAAASSSSPPRWPRAPWVQATSVAASATASRELATG